MAISTMDRKACSFRNMSCIRYPEGTCQWLVIVIERIKGCSSLLSSNREVYTIAAFDYNVIWQ